MTSFPFAIVGFDLDGTLLDTSADLAAAVNHALVQAGRPSLSVAVVRPMIGGGGRHMLAQALTATGGCDEAQLDALEPVLMEFYGEHLANQSRPFPGAVAALDALRACSVRLAVVTNKRERFTRPLLAAAGLLDRFACVIGGDTLGAGATKPSPAPIHAMIERCGGGRAAFVGDSRYDVEAGKAAGVPTVAVGFGFLSGPVAALGADAVIDRYDQLIPTLERLG